MKSFKATLLVLAGAVLGTVFSHMTIATANAGVPAYRVLQHNFSNDDTGARDLQEFLNAQARQGYRLQQLDGSANMAILIKQ